MAPVIDSKHTAAGEEDGDCDVIEIRHDEWSNGNGLDVADGEIHDLSIGDTGSVKEKEEEEVFIPIEEQRAIIQRLLDQAQPGLVEGILVYVIYQKWWDLFWNETIESPFDAKLKIGSIDTKGITDNNGIFCDYNTYPLKELPVDVFKQIQEWYGLTPNSRIVQTFLVEENGELIPEYSKHHFYLHHLSIEPSGSSYNPHYTRTPSFTISRLHNIHALIQHCITTLDNKERLSKYHPDFEEQRFRVWILRDENILHLPYNIPPSTFVKLENKILLKKQHYGIQLKGSGLQETHLLIERYTSGKSIKESKGFWPSNYYIHYPPTPSDGRIGLSNLGNTCYMNSALQCLVHIPELTQYFLFDCFQGELNADNPLGNGGKVALAFSNLIHNLFDKKSNRGTSYTPRDFKQTVGHFNQMFAGFHQQDSQEFLAFLLDGLHEDLNRIIKKPFVEKPELNEKDANNMEAIRDLATKSWQQHKLRNDSVIIDLFVGLYKSTLVCPSCDKISITFDPFNDLTLPLPVPNQWTGKVLLFLEDGPIKSFEVELPKTSTYNTLKNYIGSKLNLNPVDFITAEIWNNQFYRNFESPESQAGYLPISDLIADKDIVVVYQVKRQEGDLVVPVLNTVLPDNKIPSAFGFPFFITLAPEELNSFGAIRQKLEHRYEQLSTFDYFSKTRQAQNKERFTISDFELDNDIDSKSDISLANPEISGEYAFKIKKFDSSKEIRPRKKIFQRKNSPVIKDSGDGIWTPHSGNNFTNLPDLLDFVDEKKAKFYKHANKHLSEATREEEQKQEQTDDNTEIIDLTNELDGKLDGPIDSTDVLNVDSASSIENVEPFFTPKINPEDPEIIPDESIDVVAVKNLLEYKTALVCEWTPDEFDIFFSGLEDEGKGGVNTWSTPEVLVNEELEESRQRRESEKNQNLTLDQCLKLFSKAEVLGEHDLWYCSNCKEHRQATKQIQIWSTPDILSIHLKRFENQRSFSDKIDATVDFPIRDLDMRPYLADTVTDKDGYLYDLFAVDNHFGGLGGGHYTSYVKNFVDNKWYYYDDSRVTPAKPEESIKGAAYLLFYKRKSAKFLGGDSLGKMLQAAREEHDQHEREELERLETFYRANKGDSSEDDDDDDEDDDLEDEHDDLEEDEDDEDDDYSVTEQENKENKAPIMSSRRISDAYSSSIHVGPDDDDDDSSNRRKQRLLRIATSRGIPGRRTGIPIVVPSDVESPAPGSPTTSPSDDDCSSYSVSATAPTPTAPRYS